MTSPSTEPRFPADSRKNVTVRVANTNMRDFLPLSVPMNRNRVSIPQSRSQVPSVSPLPDIPSMPA